MKMLDYQVFFNKQNSAVTCYFDCWSAIITPTYTKFFLIRGVRKIVKKRPLASSFTPVCHYGTTRHSLDGFS